MALIQMNPNKRLLSLANTWTLDQYINLNSANPGLKVNQSGSGLLMELQASGADKFNVDNAGLATSLVYGIATTPTDAFWADNRTAATAGVPAQYSPSMHWGGTAWKSNAVAASQRVDAIAYLETATGASAPTGKVILAFSINEAAYATKFNFGSDGKLYATLGGVNLITFTKAADVAARTVTFPDADITVTGQNIDNAFSVAQAFASNISFNASASILAYSADGGTLLLQA